MRKKVRFILYRTGITDEAAYIVLDLFDKYIVALSIIEYKRDYYKRIIVTKKLRRARSKPTIDTTFIEKYG